MRMAAAEHADKRCDRSTQQWQDSFDDFISGWLASSVNRNATIRLKVKAVP
jgi:hypothetical protein